MAGNEQTPLLAPDGGLLASVRARRAFIAKFAVAVAVFALALWAAGDVCTKKHAGVAKSQRYVCGNADKSHSGYIKLANKQDDHYFYWFFEAEQDTGKEPLVLWLTGGPGSSSLFALLTENGPCTINADLSTTTNAYAWNRNANYIWLEQPTGVGFSFGAPADEDHDETDVGANIYWFLQGFLKKFPQFEGREFYITGESYGGHYVPGASHYVWQQTKQQLANPSGAANTSIINIKGIAIGNGLTNPTIQYAYNQDMVNNQYNVTLLTPEQTQQMKQDSVECIELTKQCEATPSNGTLCVSAQGCWGDKLIGPFFAANRDNYDIRRECNHSDPTACDDTKYVRKYLNLPEVRGYLNVDSRVEKWLEDSAEVYTVFSGRDWSMSYHTYVADMLNDGLRVLVYAGDADLMCNWIGNRAWTLALDWRGKDGFNAAVERALISHDPLVADSPAVDAGVVRSFENFAFARVYEAGHMVPMDQPAVALDLINKFLYGQAY